MATRRDWLKGVAGAAIGIGLGPTLEPSVRAQAGREIQRRFAATEQLPWLALGGLPTPVTAHPRLARRLGLGALYVKRDDRAGEVFGGSKARKLALLLGDARRRGARSILTYGGVASNHALATAVHGTRLGFRVHLVLLHEPPSPRARSHMLAALGRGATLHAGTRTDREDPARALARFAPGENAVVLPPGGTSPLGNVGYVDAGFELAHQVRAGLLPRPDVVYVTAGTTGTAAGLFVGLRASGVSTRVIAVRASGRRTAHRARVASEVRGTVELLRSIDASFPALDLDDSFALEHRFVGPGYAAPTAWGGRAIEVARGELALDSTYTAKTFAALSARADEHRSQTVLFWNTFDPRRPSTDGVQVGDLPPRLRPYARE